MTTALHVLLVAGVWFVACCLFAGGAVLVQSTREVLRERNTR